MSSNGSTRSPPLPIEVVELILADVDDQKSLKSCSLISKDFLRPSQKLLFQNIKFALVPDDVKKAQFSNSPQNMPTQTMDFLISSPIHSSMVSNIHISGKDIPIDATSTSSWKSTIVNIGTLLSQLTHLRHVTIESSFISDWTMLNADLKNALLGFYILPTLRHLELHHIGISEQELASFLQIPRLTLVGVNLSPTLLSENYKLSLDVNSSITELKVVLTGSEMVQCMFDIAKAARATLKSLSWHTSPHSSTGSFLFQSISQGTDQDDPGDFFRLPPEMTLFDFPSLIFISICIPVGMSTIEDLVLLFKQQDKCQVHPEVIQLILENEHLADDVVTSWDWQGLDIILSSPAYVTLKTLYISLKKMIAHRQPSPRRHDTPSSEALTLFRMKLPSLLGNGVNIEARDD